MSRSMLSPVAALELVSSLRLTRRTQPWSLTLRSAQRIIVGRAFASAACLEQATSASSAPSSVPGLCGLR